MTGTRENGIRGSRDWDGLQGSRLALQSVRESVSWENMKGWGVSSSETDQRRSHTGDMESQPQPRSHKVPLGTTAEMTHRSEG